MSLDAIRATWRKHARDFTFTVLRPGTEEVIGCQYIHPAKDDGHDADVRSWVRADAADLDGPLHAAVSRWLVERPRHVARGRRRSRHACRHELARRVHAGLWLSGAATARRQPGPRSELNRSEHPLGFPVRMLAATSIGC
jgi:hypothetical protein